MATAVSGNVPRKSRDQIRRVTALKHPPRTAKMSANVAVWKAKRTRWQKTTSEPRIFERPTREIVKNKRRARRARVIG